MENTGETLDSGIAGSSVLPQPMQNLHYTSHWPQNRGGSPDLCRPGIDGNLYWATSAKILNTSYSARLVVLPVSGGATDIESR